MLRTTPPPIDCAADAEFGWLARQTVAAALTLVGDDRVAAGCRGRANPFALRWLAERVIADVTDRFLDVGSGLGGPSAWLRDHFGLTTWQTDPQPEAVSGARRLFGLSGAVARAEQLPFRARAFDSAWCLATLSTTSDRAVALAEMRRVLARGARRGLLDYVTTDGDRWTDEASGNTFCGRTELRGLMASIGFDIVAEVNADALPPAPATWEASADYLDDAIAACAGDDFRYTAARARELRVEELLAEQAIRPELIVAVAV